MGSNVGDRLSYMLKALELLKSLGEVLRVSTIYESKAWGVVNQRDFLNCVVKFKTELEPVELLRRLKEIEKLVGRKERERWGPREIDIDILLYEKDILMLSFLVVPHPYLTRRDFVLVPLLELEPQLEHPLYKRPLSEYLKSLDVSLKPFACLVGIQQKAKDKEKNH